MDNNAFKLYLQSIGFYDESADSSYKKALSENKIFQNIVCTDMNEYVSVLNVVGHKYIKDAINLYLFERNNYQNPWVLINLYRGLGSGSISLSNAMDIFCNLEEGPRKRVVSKFVCDQKSMQSNNVEATLEYIGSFASIMIVVANYMDKVFRDLDEYNDRYYTTMCDVVVKHCSTDFMLLEFIAKTQSPAMLYCSDLTLLSSLACCGDDSRVKKFFDIQYKRSKEIELKNTEMEKLVLEQAAPYVKDLLSNICKKSPTQFNYSF